MKIKQLLSYFLGIVWILAGLLTIYAMLFYDYKITFNSPPAYFYMIHGILYLISGLIIVPYTRKFIFKKYYKHFKTYQLVIIWFIPIIVISIFTLFSLNNNSELNCGNDNECFLKNLENCQKRTYFEDCNMIIGCQKAEIIGEQNNKCEVHRWDSTPEGTQINIDKTCLISKDYKPLYFWVTDGMCN